MYVPHSSAVNVALSPDSVKMISPPELVTKIYSVNSAMSLYPVASIEISLSGHSGLGVAETIPASASDGITHIVLHRGGGKSS